MLLLIDFNNLMWRTMHAPDVDIKGTPNVSYWKYLIYDNIYQQFTREDKIDELVVAVDDKNQWRKAYFSRYKESRKNKRDKTGIDFNYVFDTMNRYLAELKHYMPFKVLKIKACEADDIIGVLAMTLPSDIIISSNDEDYIQCLSARVRVWNPTKRKYIQHNDPKKFITMKCLMGQPKDDIFNVKTPITWGKTADTIGKRKPGLGPVAAEKIMSAGVEDWLHENEAMHRFKRNQNLIDFKKIPSTVQNRILDTYYNYNFPPPRNMLQFFKEMSFQTYLENWHRVENCLMRLY